MFLRRHEFAAKVKRVVLPMAGDAEGRALPVAVGRRQESVRDVVGGAGFEPATLGL